MDQRTAFAIAKVYMESLFKLYPEAKGLPRVIEDGGEADVVRLSIKTAKGILTMIYPLEEGTRRTDELVECYRTYQPCGATIKQLLAN